MIGSIVTAKLTSEEQGATGTGSFLSYEHDKLVMNTAKRRTDDIFCIEVK
jgi:hypothetical protein